MIDYIRQGGIVMIPIIISSVAALTIVIEKCFNLLRIRTPNVTFFNSLYDLIRKQEWEQAQIHCKRFKHPIAEIFEAGLEETTKDHTDLRAVEERMQLKGDELIHQLESSVRLLGAIITILPLLGFLGTIIGLISSFQSWERMGTNVTISDLAGGIYQAMITTAAGLILAIPYFLAHAYLTSRIERINMEYSKIATDFLSRLRAAIFRNDLRNNNSPERTGRNPAKLAPAES